MFLLRDTTHRMLLRYHPSIGHLFVPNQRARVPSERGGYYVVTNGAGFRSDVEYTAAKGRRPRMLFFGDSYTAGDNCENAERFSERVGAAFDADVYNYGLPGSAVDQSLLVLDECAAGVERDLIVLCVHTDSIRRIQQRARPSIDRTTRQRILVPKPYFTLDGDALRLHNVPVPRVRPVTEPAGVEGPERGGLVARGLDIYRNSARLALLRDIVRRRLPRWQSRAYRMLGVRPYQDYASERTAGWRLQEAIIRRFLDRAAPTPVLIVPVPGYQYFLHGADPAYQRLFERLEDPARGIYVADITAPMQQLPWKTRRTLCFTRDSHFSPAGHDVAARAIGDRISSAGLLAPGGTVAASVPAPRKTGARYVLGVSCFYHDAAACLVRDGELVAAAQEERFTRVKHDRRFPRQAINACLEEAGIHPPDLAAVVYHENASLALERIMRSQLAAGEAGEDLYTHAMPSWLRFKLRWPKLFRRELGYTGLVLQDDHHRSHAASAFYPSPFERAAILTIDGVGEWATASIGVGNGREIRMLQEMRFPNSLGLLYSAFTQFTGFEVNEGEYKMMGLAPYGEPKYSDLILRELVDLKADGSLSLNMDYFGFLKAPSMVNDGFARLFGGPARTGSSPITRREMDIARSIQDVTEESMLRMARHAHALTGEANLCMAGGVALNCVGNGRILREGPFERLWIQPAAGDAGASLGAALDACHTYFGQPRLAHADSPQAGSLLGPSYSDDEVLAFLDTGGYPAEEIAAGALPARVADVLAQGSVVGVLSGRMEFGPRALGARSILGDPRNAETQVTLNVRIKYRESFRPFAPAVLDERAADYFDLDHPSPYMLIVAPVREERRYPRPADAGSEDLLAIVRQARSDIPAVTHVDYSARVQTVTRRDNAPFYDLIEAFERRTGTAVIVNTSYNVRGEPIVCTPYDAYRCFMRTEMDYLVLGSFLLRKTDQPAWPEPKADHDTPRVSTTVEDPLEPAVRAFHRDRLAPLSRELGERAGLPSWRDAPSAWVNLDATSDPCRRFEVPAALDARDAAIADLSAAVTADWMRDDAGVRLARILPELLRHCEAAPDAGDAGGEELPDSVYVMF